jgi:hypothetical protein
MSYVLTRWYMCWQSKGRGLFGVSVQILSRRASRSAVVKNEGRESREESSWVGGEFGVVWSAPWWRGAAPGVCFISLSRQETWVSVDSFVHGAM